MLFRSQASPAAFGAMVALEQFVRASGLEAPLVELVRIRASQINQCAFCIDLHATEARAAGESERRIVALSAWRHSPFYTSRERSALAWTEAVTLIAHTPPDGELLRTMLDHFSEAELVNLTMACNAINNWNRLAIAFRLEPPAAEPGEGVA